MKPFMMPLLALMSASCLSGAAYGRANSVDADHVGSALAIVVEHAEILLSSAKGDYAEGYLAIWNGTQIQANLTSVTSDIFGRSEIYRNAFGKVEAIQGGVFIPGHHLVLKEATLPLDRIGDVTLKLDFEDGTRLSVPARIVRSGDDLTDHRHGEGDTTYRQR